MRTAPRGARTWVSWPVVSRRGGQLRRRVEVRGWEPPPEDPIDEATGEPRVWEAGHVRAWIREAMDTLRRLPLPKDGLPRRPSSHMPEVLREFVEAYGYDRGRSREPVSAREIDRLDRVLDWLLWLEARRDVVVVTGIALGLNLRAAGRLVGRSHEWCRQRERAAVEAIARRLNRERRRAAAP
ncbi:MAG: DUF6362 family protein [Kiloniellales bacterium]|nr:DUF6362 family protein [Kiloniellales bacterium]